MLCRLFGMVARLDIQIQFGSSVLEVQHMAPIVRMCTIPKCGKRKSSHTQVAKNGMIYSGDVQGPNIFFGNANIFQGFQWPIWRHQLPSMAGPAQAEHWRTFQWGIGSRPGLTTKLRVQNVSIVGRYAYNYVYMYIHIYVYIYACNSIYL